MLGPVSRLGLIFGAIKGSILEEVLLILMFFFLPSTVYFVIQKSIFCFTYPNLSIFIYLLLLDLEQQVRYVSPIPHIVEEFSPVDFQYWYVLFYPIYFLILLKFILIYGVRNGSNFYIFPPYGCSVSIIPLIKKFFSLLRLKPRSLSCHLYCILYLLFVYVYGTEFISE